MPDGIQDIYAAYSAYAQSKGKNLTISEDEFRNRITSERGYADFIYGKVGGNLNVSQEDYYGMIGGGDSKKKSIAQQRYDLQSSDSQSSSDNQSASTETVETTTEEQPVSLAERVAKAAKKEEPVEETVVEEKKPATEESALEALLNARGQLDIAKKAVDEAEKEIPTNQRSQPEVNQAMLGLMALSKVTGKDYKEAVQRDKDSGYLSAEDQKTLESLKGQVSDLEGQIKAIENSPAEFQNPDMLIGIKRTQLATSKKELQQLQEKAKIRNTDDYLTLIDLETYKPVAIKRGPEGMMQYRQDAIKELAGGPTAGMRSEFAGKMYGELTADQKRVVDNLVASKYADPISFGLMPYDLEMGRGANLVRKATKSGLNVTAEFLKAADSLGEIHQATIQEVYDKARFGMITEQQFNRQMSELTNYYMQLPREDGYIVLDSKLPGITPISETESQTGKERFSKKYKYSPDQVSRWLSKMPSFKQIAFNDADSPYAEDLSSATGRAGTSIEDLSNKIKTNPLYDDEFRTKVAEGIGSSIPFMIAAIAGSAVGLPAGVAVAITGGFSQAQGQYIDAIKSGAKPDEAIKAFAGGFAIGTSEALPIERMLNRMGGLAGWDALKGMLISGTEEAIQETFQSIATEELAKFLYDETRGMNNVDITDPAVGFMSGLLISGFTELVKRPDYKRLPAQTKAGVEAVYQAFKDNLKASATKAAEDEQQGEDTSTDAAKATATAETETPATTDEKVVTTTETYTGEGSGAATGTDELDTETVTTDGETTEETSADVETEAVEVQPEKKEGQPKPIRQLSTGANIYYETGNLRVNDSKDKVLLNVTEKGETVPSANIEFDDAAEAVAVAERINKDFPDGVPPALKIKEYVQDVRDELNGASNPSPTSKSKKEPWQMTREEYEANPKMAGPVQISHRFLITEALKEGKPVPQEVLDQYKGIKIPGKKSSDTSEKKARQPKAFKPKKEITSEQLGVEDKGNALSALNKGWDKFAGSEVKGKNVVIRFSDKSKTERTIVTASAEQAKQVADDIQTWIQHKQEVRRNRSAAAKKRGFAVPDYVKKFEPTSEKDVALVYIASGGRLRGADITHHSGIQDKEISVGVKSNKEQPIDVIAAQMADEMGLDEQTLITELAAAAANGVKASREEIKSMMSKAGVEAVDLESDEPVIDVDEIDEDMDIERIQDMLDPIRTEMGEKAWREWEDYVDSYKDENGVIDYEKAIAEAPKKYKGFVQLLTILDEKLKELYPEDNAGDDSTGEDAAQQAQQRFDQAKAATASAEAKVKKLESEVRKMEEGLIKDQAKDQFGMFGGQGAEKQLFNDRGDRKKALDQKRRELDEAQKELQQALLNQETAENAIGQKDMFDNGAEEVLPFSRRKAKRVATGKQALTRLRRAFPGIRVNILKGEALAEAVRKALTPRFMTRSGEAYQDERTRIETEAKANGTWLKAPNGKPTNLNPGQWVTVRTKAFKEWFGDWETDPANASKVVDENGEPMVVYHGASATYDVFDRSKRSYGSGDAFLFLGDGFYFTNDKSVAESYVDSDIGGRLVEAFLNIRIPYESKDWRHTSAGFPGSFAEELGVTPKNIKLELEKRGHDGVISEDKENMDYEEYMVMESTQIKSATGNSGAFDKSNPNIVQEPKKEYQNKIKTAQYELEFNTQDGEVNDYSGEKNIDEVYMERVLSKIGHIDLTGPTEIKSSADVAWLFRHLEDAATENAFVVLHLPGGAYEVLYLSTGGTTGTVVQENLITAAAKKVGATSVTMVHNHPSGNLQPSQGDYKVHSQIKKSASLAGISVNDSVIINLDSGQYTIFNEAIDTETRDKGEQPDLSFTPAIKQFDKQKLYKPIGDFEKVSRSKDVAEFLSKQKRGVGKIGVITLSRSNNITRYTLLDASTGENGLLDFMASTVGLHGEAFILSIDEQSGINMKSVYKKATSSGIQVLDIVETKSDKSIIDNYDSWVDSSKLSEPDIRFSKKAQQEQDKNEAFAADVVNGFYSPLEQIIGNSKQDKMPAIQWLKKFANTEEAKWTGLQAWLEQQTGSITKQEILDFMKENRIQVEVKIRSSASAQEGFDRYQSEMVRIQDKYNVEFEEEPIGPNNTVVITKIWHILPDGTYMGEIQVGRDGRFDTRDYKDMSELSPSDAEEMAQNMLTDDQLKQLEQEVAGLQNMVNSNDQQFNPDTSSPHYGSYTLPGENSNYREVLVTLPNKDSFNKKYDIVFEDGFILKDKSGGIVKKTNIVNRQVAEDRFREEFGNESDQFRSSHFDEPNILVHLRMDTRVDADGNKVLFLEEIQSDWGQKGKRQGFNKPAKYKTLPSGEKYRKDIEKIVGEVGSLYYESDEYGESVFFEKDRKVWVAQIEDGTFDEEFINEVDDQQVLEEYTSGVPAAPFVTDTNSWVKLGLKIALQQAVAEGADKIAWTTGEQQNERYDLSKQVDKIEWRKDGDEYTLNITSKGNQSGRPDNTMKAKNLAELEGIVGKEIAQKIESEASRKTKKVDIEKKIFEGSKNTIQEGKWYVETPSGYTKRADNKDHALQQAREAWGGTTSKGVIEGENLRIGGSGMKGFYGSETGQQGIVGAVAKKLFGQDVGELVINLGNVVIGVGRQSIEDNLVKNNRDQYAQLQFEYEMEASLAKRENIKKQLDELNDEYKELLSKGKNNLSPQPSITITDELRSEVKKGLPLFNRTTDEILGFFDENTGEITLNEDVFDDFVALEEFGHLWLRLAEIAKPALYKAGLKLAKQSPMFEEINSDPAYESIWGNEDAVANEVLAKTIAGKGVEKLNQGLAGKFRDWLKNFWQAVREFLHSMGLRTTPGVNINKLTLNKLADAAARELLKTTPLTEVTSETLAALDTERGVVLGETIKRGILKSESRSKTADKIGRRLQSSRFFQKSYHSPHMGVGREAMFTKERVEARFKATIAEMEIATNGYRQTLDRYLKEFSGLGTVSYKAAKAAGLQKIKDETKRITDLANSWLHGDIMLSELPEQMQKPLKKIWDIRRQLTDQIIANRIAYGDDIISGINDDLEFFLDEGFHTLEAVEKAIKTLDKRLQKELDQISKLSGEELEQKYLKIRDDVDAIMPEVRAQVLRNIEAAIKLREWQLAKDTAPELRALLKSLQEKMEDGVGTIVPVKKPRRTISDAEKQTNKEIKEMREKLAELMDSERELTEEERYLAEQVAFAMDVLETEGQRPMTEIEFNRFVQKWAKKLFRYQKQMEAEKKNSLIVQEVKFKRRPDGHFDLVMLHINGEQSSFERIPLKEVEMLFGKRAADKFVLTGEGYYKMPNPEILQNNRLYARMMSQDGKYVHRAYQMHMRPDWVQVWRDEVAVEAQREAADYLSTKLKSTNITSVRVKKGAGGTFFITYINDAGHQTKAKRYQNLDGLTSKDNGVLSQKDVDIIKAKLESEAEVLHTLEKPSGFQDYIHFPVSADEVQALMDLIVSSDLFRNFNKGARVSGFDPGIFKERGDIAPEIRKIMGELEDPVVNWTQTVTKMAEAVKQAEFVREFLDGGGAWVSDTKSKDYPVEIGKSKFFTLPEKKKYYVTEEAANLIDGVSEDFGNMNAYVALMGYAKLAHTIYYPESQSRNFWGAAVNMLATGNINYKDLAVAVQAISQGMYKGESAGVLFSVPLATVAGASKLKDRKGFGFDVDNDSQQELYVRMTKAGILNESVSANILKAQQAVIEKRKVREKTQKLTAPAIKAYEASDNLFKAVQWLNEVRTLQKAYPDASQEWIDIEAGKIVRATAPTYSRLPGWVRWWSSVLPVGSFVSWPTAMIITRAEIMRQAAAEVTSGNPVLVQKGIKRTTGLIASLSLTPVLAMVFSRIFGWGDDDDEMVSVLSPNFAKNNIRLYTSSDKVNTSFIDLTYLDPSSMFYRPVMAWLREPEGGIKKPLAALREFADPYISTDMFVQTVFEAWQGEDAYGQHIWEDADTAEERLKKQAFHVSKIVAPQFLFTGMRVSEAVKAELYPEHQRSKFITKMIGDREYELASELSNWMLGAKMRDIDLQRSAGSVVRHNYSLMSDVGILYSQNDITSDYSDYDYADARAEVFFNQGSEALKAIKHLYLANGLSEKEANELIDQILDEKNVAKYLRDDFKAGEYPGLTEERPRGKNQHTFKSVKH